ncbi:MAG TPA: restriction endonuclease subunit S [Egibacteraceae bacterium]|nr:restriction endonuclease subunit S [Egibacteraceae bacterium]
MTAEFVDDDYRFPVASIRECQGAAVDLSACNYTTADFFEHLRAANRAPRAGDLLFIRNVSVGLVSVVAPDLPDFAIGQETVLLRRNSDVHPFYLRYALVGAEARHAIEGAMIGSTFRRINVSAIRSLPVPAPPLDEQCRIAAYLDEQTSKIDQLIAETERFIELARERRASLITAAVTGQIDVRETT